MNTKLSQSKKVEDSRLVASWIAYPEVLEKLYKDSPECFQTQDAQEILADKLTYEWICDNEGTAEAYGISSADVEHEVYVNIRNFQKFEVQFPNRRK